MRELRIIYRSESHAPFWVLAEQTGIWEKSGLHVNTSPQLNRERAVDALKNGHVDLISGNHHNLYARRAKNHEDFVHLAQLGNLWTENHLIVTDSIRSVQDLRGKQIAVDRKNSHAGLNVWLFMRQEGLDLDKEDYYLVETDASTEKRCKGVFGRRVRRGLCRPTAQSTGCKGGGAGDHGAGDADGSRRHADDNDGLR